MKAHCQYLNMSDFPLSPSLLNYVPFPLANQIVLLIAFC